MLQMNRDIPITGPMLSEIFISFARAAEPMRKNNHGKWTSAFRIVNLYGYLAVAFGIHPIVADNFYGKRASRLLVFGCGVGRLRGKGRPAGLNQAYQYQ